MPSKLEQLQLQFRQRLIQEREERMIKIHTDNQQKALSKVMKYEAPPVPVTSRKPPPPPNNSTHQSPVKKSSPGVDRSRPLPPISREQKSHTAVGRNNGFSSEVNGRSPFQNGVRSKSMDADAGDHFKLNARSKTRTNNVTHGVDSNNSTTTAKSSVNHVGRRSPSESDTQRRTHTELIRAKALAKAQASQVNESSKLNGFHTSSVAKKSSTQESKPPTNIKSQVSTNFINKGKSKTTMPTTVSRKPTSVVAKAQNGQNVPQMRKPPNPNQDQCKICGRNFNKDRIEKHQSICAKNSKKKVKVFDATKMRVQGTEAETFVKKSSVIASEPSKAKKANWKKQHEEFINTIRQAKMAQRHLAAGGKLSDLPPPPPSDTSDYVPCQYCGRKFSEQVAERHIPKCKNILSNKKNPMKKK